MKKIKLGLYWYAGKMSSRTLSALCSTQLEASFIGPVSV